jgi:hypothetical protein
VATNGVMSPDELSGLRTAVRPVRSPGWAGVGERLPKSRRRRRPAVTALGLFLVVLFATVSGGLVVRGEHNVSVLALAHPVPAGQQITAADLRVARISGSEVSAIAAASMDTVVGETATSSLPAGTLLSAGMLSSSPVPPAGQQVVAVSFKAGMVPAEVTAGRDVSLVAIASAVGGKAPAGPAVVVPRAPVVSVTSDPSTGAVVLSVQVLDTAAPRVAQLAAVGGLSVTLLPVTP